MKENTLKVGEFVWLFDINYRVYPEGGGGPIWRGHWRKTEIEAITSRSYIVRGGHMKLPLKGKYITTEQELDELCFVNDNAYKIGQRVRDCRDYATLRAIENLLAKP